MLLDIYYHGCTILHVSIIAI